MGDILVVKTTKEFSDSTVAKILELLENATDKKAKTETVVSKVSKIYTPVVLYSCYYYYYIITIYC